MSEANLTLALTFIVTVEECNLICSGLAKLPWETSNDLICKMLKSRDKQLAEQRQVKEPETVSDGNDTTSASA